MAVVSEKMLPPSEQAKLRPAPRPRIALPPRTWFLTPTRIALLVSASIAIAFGPEPWVRSLCALLVGLLVYLAGWRDGRRDLAADALLRGGERPTDRAA